MGRHVFMRAGGAVGSLRGAGGLEGCSSRKRSGKELTGTWKQRGLFPRVAALGLGAEGSPSWGDDTGAP